jgi:hypothetical protein
VSSWVAVDPKGVVFDGISDSRRTPREHLPFGGLDFADLDVEMKLLGSVRVREPRRQMFGGTLKCQPLPLGAGQDNQSWSSELIEPPIKTA